MWFWFFCIAAAANLLVADSVSPVVGTINVFVACLCIVCAYYEYKWFN